MAGTGSASLPFSASFCATLVFSRISREWSCKACTASPSRTQKIMENISFGSDVGGAGGASSYAALKRMDQQWQKMRRGKSVTGPVPEVVRRDAGSCTKTISEAEVYDAVVCGGTLGIFVAAVLSIKGFKCAVIEKGKLQGRSQEWNISRKELDELVKYGLLSSEGLQSVIAAEFNPNRCGFESSKEVWVEDILNLGVSPLKLLELVKDKFLETGGTLLEGTAVSKLNIFDDAAVLMLDNNQTLYSRLVIDAMGNFSPIVRQIRWGQRPDGICLVVGTCARGFENNTTSDVIYSSHPAIPVGKSNLQIFWEAFPAGSGPKDRTTYLFSYMDVSPERPSLEQLLELYWDLMPEYQNVQLINLEIMRVLFGIFPTYRSSPLQASFDRVLQVGDASGIQSPVSFGGFGSITRHLGRLAHGISESLEEDLLDKGSLALLNPYMPNLSASWLFQKAMSAQTKTVVNNNFINTLLATNFHCMQKLGDPVLRPFLQDVIQFGPLAKTLGSIILSRPDILPSIFKQVGLQAILEWIAHFTWLGIYSILSTTVTPLLLPQISKMPKKEQFVWRRRFDAWKYGSGLDYKL
ncbi:hypothetical protein GOP47_0000143 [Adiantum capillus-veneris]|uniref:Uncharacterized protein n=1 Tax=Adiantum capillus-veneris TaxID=13818 RepID=A0A9D4VDD4_ADICA|nr:hypothetical protein GOP47_0000143 [Adiantum capillus-veneris]